MDNIIKPSGYLNIGPSSHLNTNTIIVPNGYFGDIYVPNGLGGGNMYGPNGFTGTEFDDGTIVYDLIGTSILPTPTSSEQNYLLYDYIVLIF